MKSKFPSDKCLPQSLLDERQVVGIRMSQYIWRSLIDGSLKPQQRVHKFSGICLQDFTLKEAETLAIRNIHIQACLHNHFPTCREIQCQTLLIQCQTTLICCTMGFNAVVVTGFRSALCESKSFRCLFVELFSNKKVRECINTLQVTCHHRQFSLDHSPSK